MIEWWGPIIWEFYSASEGHGVTMLNSQQWLAHPGSVGLPVIGTPHIVLEDGSVAPAGVTGDIYFDGGYQFEYHNDPGKTRSAYNKYGWASVGDRGYLDDEGYLYLAGRSNDMIISGGINIYPRDAEDALALHPLVSDVAVIGVPNPEFGEEVKAVVVLLNPADAGEDTAQLLIEHCRARIARFKCPRSVDFVSELPRLPNGKLYKRLVREPYWKGRSSQIV
jgi:fatty-acyl-CoA synthase